MKIFATPSRPRRQAHESGVNSCTPIRAHPCVRTDHERKVDTSEGNGLNEATSDGALNRLRMRPELIVCQPGSWSLLRFPTSPSQPRHGALRKPIEERFGPVCNDRTFLNIQRNTAGSSEVEAKDGETLLQDGETESQVWQEGLLLCGLSPQCRPHSR